MAIVDIEGLRCAIRAGSRLLGLDVGGKTVGLALSDGTLLVATPLLTLRRKRFSIDAAALAETVSRYDVGGLVIGLPVSMDGSEGPRCQSVRQFADNLRQLVDLPMAFWDERWSTKVVERMLVAEADISRRRRRQVVDKLAAAYILQGALDFIGTRPQHFEEQHLEGQQ